MFLIIGLGNPGKRYEKTRHNIGFLVLDGLAERLGQSFCRNKFKGEYLEGRLPDEWVRPSGEDDKLILVKPQTFMNLSGECVVCFSGYFKVPVSRILVVVDDVALPLGRMRLRKDGSAGGHNGLRDIEARLGTKDYPRLRIGVGGREEGREGRPPLSDHVLGRFQESEQDELKKALKRAGDACFTWIGEGMEAAMNRFNPAE